MKKTRNTWRLAEKKCQMMGNEENWRIFERFSCKNLEVWKKLVTFANKSTEYNKIHSIYI